MRATPYLFFPGTCREAMTFYAKTLNRPEPDLMTFAQMPDEDRATMPGVPVDAVMNATLGLGGGGVLLASDDPGGDEGGRMAGASIHLDLPSTDAAHRVFAALAEGGTIGMPIAATFWAAAFGTVTDRYGVRWMVSTEEGAAA
ncbi:MAG: VOC family protein [Paracoccaceae bacterium]